MYLSSDERKNNNNQAGQSGAENKIIIKARTDNAEHCVCCGAIVPEGREICPICESRNGNNL
ncbi:MAG: hypothetical protein CVU97_01010 [Firmicutes bacterium HGW-Firmicutes-21]|nr:MAG: hypothetical protein CVU97_01010 [Firmicutes bacterium HGW-Firmicutes-21]